MATEKPPEALDQSFIDGMRRRIDVAMIIDKLNAHVRDPRDTPMSKTQLQAATVLLKKVMPDLQSTHMTADQGFASAFAEAVRSANGISTDPI